MKIDVLKSVLKIIDEDLALLNKRRYSNNLKESFEFGKGVLIKLKQQIEGDSANVQEESKIRTALVTKSLSKCDKETLINKRKELQE